jgi:hypothetical protein
MLRPVAVLLVVLTLAIPARAQGVLEHARQDADRPSFPDTSVPAPAPLSSAPAVGSGEGDVYGALALIGLAVVTAPVWFPPIWLNDPFPVHGWFPGHPYALPDIGYIDRGAFREGAKDLDFFDSQRVKSWSTRATVEAGDNFSGLTRVGGRFALDTEWRVGVTSAWDFYRERQPCGCIDETVIGDLNLTVRFAQASWIQMYTGLGARGMFDANRTRAGVNFQYGADFFLADPVVVSTLFEMGNLREAFVTRLRATVGIQMQHAELFAGYDWLRIGGADLQGPMVGLRLWF